MKARNSNSEERKRVSTDESSDEDGSVNDENSNLAINDDDSDETVSYNVVSSESEEENTSDGSSVIKKKVKKQKLHHSNVFSNSSDSGDETCEKCAICLKSIFNQEVGSPEGCDHLFCSVCIIEWSKNSNVCPLDRQKFSIILVRKNKNGSVVKQLSVEEPKSSYLYDEDADNTHCEICGETDREDVMLLCDGCQRGFHIQCLSPPLEQVPTEEEWFCPSCSLVFSFRTRSEVLQDLEELNDIVRERRSQNREVRNLVGTRIRTRLLERIRLAVNRIVTSCFLDSDEDEYDDDNDDDDEDGGDEYDDDVESDDLETEDSFDEEIVSTESRPGTSGTQRTKKVSPSKKKKTKSRKRRTRKSTSKRNVKRNSKKKKTAGSKRKGKSRSTAKSKVSKVSDAGVATKISKPRSYKKRRKQRVKKKVKTAASLRRSGASATPKTVKGRLAMTLGIVPVTKPGQLLPDIKVRSNRNELSGIDINRARAGIPRLHIFEPRHELQVYSSGSDGEGYAEGGNSSLTTFAQPRVTVSSIRDRKRAALLLQSTEPASVKPKPAVEEPSKEVDILDSILRSQAIWHSKNTDVKIKEDGSVEISDEADKNIQGESNNDVDIRGTASETVTTQAPLYPGSSSRPGGFRPYNRTSFGDSRGTQDGSISARGSTSQSGIGFSRFGSASRNDREGYANYLNNMPQGPTPFCRGGPPLRFRMPSRQQLRRIPFPPRTNRSPWHNEEEEDESESKNKGKQEQSVNSSIESKKTDDEDVDLYSDIESNVEKADSSEQDENTGTSYPALGPPPEPSAFLLGIDENGEIAEEKSKSEVYDPAEPCDSEDEMVIDEHAIKGQSPEDLREKDTEQVQTIPNFISRSVSPTETTSPKQACQRGSTEDEDDECPIFSIYSSASREFSQKEEEEREREIAEEKRKFEEIELQDQKTDADINKNEDPAGHVEKKMKEKEDKEFSLDISINTCNTTADKEINESEKNLGKMFSFEVEMGDEKSQSHDEEESNSRSDEADPRSRSETPLGDPGRSPDSEPMRSSSHRSHSTDSEQGQNVKTSSNIRDKNSAGERPMAKISRRNSKGCDSDSELESKKPAMSDEDEDGKRIGGVKKHEKAVESGSESAHTKIATGLEGLDVEEVSSDNGEEEEFVERRSLSSFSLSDLSNRSHESPSRRRKRKKKKRKSLRRIEKKYDDADDMPKEKKKNDKDDSDKIVNEDVENAGQGEKHKKRKSNSVESDGQLGNKDNKKEKNKEKEKDLSWKKPSKKEKNYREGKRRSKERGRSKSKERRKSKSPSPKKDKKKGKDRKKKSEKKKDIERYDVRKIVKNKEIRKTDAFGRDILSKSRSISRSRSRSLIRERSRNMLRRDSRSYTRSRSRSYRRGRSPVRRRYMRSRTKSRSKSLRRSFSRSRSQSRSGRKNKKKIKSKDRLHGRSRSRGKKSRSRRRSPSSSRSRTPISRTARGKRQRSKRSWSHNSRSLSFSPRRSRSISRTPVRLRRSYTRSASSSWSRGRSPIPRGGSLEKLTVVLKTKDKKKGKKKKDGKKSKRDEDRRKQIGNSKEVFASGDNVLVSVNFGNNNNSSSNNNNGSASNETSRNARLDSMSPAPSSDRKKKRGSDYEVEKVSKKFKKSNAISKNVVDMALSNSSSKRAKKLTRLSEKDAEVILNRKPVAVIDLDMSPYREQTPSPINVVVVSDSGSGDEGKDPTPQGQNGSPASEPEKNPENADAQSTNVSIPSSPVANGYLTGPKTPPEPQIKFSIAKPQQLRQIANPLGDDDDEEDVEEVEDQEFKRIESLDRRIEKELDGSHKGPNTPPEPRGPTTPQTPPSPQTSPDAYDPFEPTKSRSPSPNPLDTESRQSPSAEKIDEQPTSSSSEALTTAPSGITLNEIEKAAPDPVAENQEDQSPDIAEKCDVIPVLESPAIAPAVSQPNCPTTTELRKEDSPERKISVVVTTTQNKGPPQSSAQKPFSLVLKPLSMTPVTCATTPAIPSNLSMPFTSFSLPSPTKTRSVPASQPVQVTGIQRLQHRLGSPVNRTPNSVKSTPEKRSTPRTEPNESGNFRTSSKRNGEQTKQTRPLQDATNETIDMTAEMDDSPYSPASSEGDDLFDPPMEPMKPAQANSKSIQPGYKPPPTKTPHKSPIKQLSKFDLLFGPTGPSLSPLKSGNKKSKPSSKPTIQPKTPTQKSTKKNSSKRGISLKMDEDQLRILDELPSSAVELQVKDKFLKKLNRQERVVDEVKTVLKPHYARKHITKEEYKDILRRSVPKICHSRSGEINPSKIQSLIEAYVRKFRHAKKKGSSNAVLKTKVK